MRTSPSENAQQRLEVELKQIGSRLDAKESELQELSRRKSELEERRRDLISQKHELMNIEKARQYKIKLIE